MIAALIAAWSTGFSVPSTKSDQIAVVVVTEAVHFIGRCNGVAKASHDMRGEFEAQIHARRANMEKNVSWRGNGVVLALDFLERMQILGLGCPKSRSQASEPKPITHDKPPLEIAKAHCTQKSRQGRYKAPVRFHDAQVPDSA